MTVESCAFGPLTIRFDQTVLRPRPWTLAQSQWAAEIAERAPAGPILELCAGVGHIGLAAAVLTGRSIVQVDDDGRACAFASANAVAAGIEDRVDIRNAPMLDAVAPDERFAVVIADPPYVPAADIARYPDDPAHAIDGGDDGLDLVASCVFVAAAHLMPAGEVVLQIRGEDQAAALGSRAPELTVADVRTYGPDRALARLVPAAEASSVPSA